MDLLPPFPPPHVVLHPEDAASKVFLAIARAFVSIDNRAMTIKDMADRASQYGLVCQNLSAAAQAITTYLRSHKARCDKQQDQPLLLSHILSGTPADDDLVPALFSRSGGDSHPLPDRLTNFRKGTAVWYLSRATGIPCPFARVGIRLCDYVTDDSPHASKHRRDTRLLEQEQACGQKRKRPLRACTGRPSDNEPPLKVKLTLRLKPLVRPFNDQGTSSARPIRVLKQDGSDSDDSDDSMSVNSDHDQSHTARLDDGEQEEPWSLPPYPRRSISIPCYTPSLEPSYPSVPSPGNAYKDPLRLSPSASFNVATPPPDSEDEADDFHVAMTRFKHYTEDEGWDGDLDSEGEAETVWESPGPRSPSAPPLQVAVKEESADILGILDPFEGFDSNLSKDLDMASTRTVKVESLDPWSWVPHQSEMRIKQEDLDLDSLFPQDAPGPSSPLSDLSSQFASFSYSDSPSLSVPESGQQLLQPPTPIVRPRAKTVPAQRSASPPTSITLPVTSRSLSTSSSGPSSTLVRLLQSMSVTTSVSFPPPTPCVSPLQTRCQPSLTPSAPVVVTTCQPCKPAINAIQIEDIPVYQMMLGAFQLLRRIDTDFVNLSPILAFSGAAHPTYTIPNATVVTKGSPEVSGTWVPLAAAQAYVREHLLGDKAQALDVFLSDSLVARFPTPLQDFHKNTMARNLNQFGKHFASTLQAANWDTEVTIPSKPTAHQYTAHAPITPFLLGLSLSGDKHIEDHQMPLSATEQQIFRELCVIPDEHAEQSDLSSGMVADAPTSLDADAFPNPDPEPMSPLSPLPPSPQAAAAVLPVTPLSLSSEPNSLYQSVSLEMTSATLATTTPIQLEVSETSQRTSEKPLRRSKRVADALAAAHSNPSRTRSHKNGSRNSLS